MSKRPKKRKPKPGQVWHLKRAPGRVVLTGEIDEIDRDTFVVRWLDDCAVKVAANALPLRFDREDWTFIARVA